MIVTEHKSATDEGVIIFSDEKTWTVDPVRNKRNDRYLSLGEENENARLLSKTKHSASVMTPSPCHLSLWCFNRMLPLTIYAIECNITCKSNISLSGRKICGRHSRQTATPWTTHYGRTLRQERALFVTRKLPSSEHPSTGNGWA